jgi:menaquinone-specific isochorismate synthase
MIIEIDPIHFPSWLSAQDLFPKFYWKCRKTGVETAALGSCLNFFEVPRFPKEKLYGAISFPSNGKDLLWKDFPSPYFFLPQVEVVQSIEKTILKVRGSPPTFKVPDSTLTSYPTLEMLDNFPNFNTWKKSIQDVLKAIRSKELQKTVLARKSVFKTNDSPFSWLQMLLLSAVNSTVFAFQVSPSSLFLGATPEMLYQRDGRKILTESIAGTRKKSAYFFEDEQIEYDLLNSYKDKEEIDCVKSFLSDSLASLCEKSSCDVEDSLIHTSELIHLHNRLEGVLKQDVHDIDILSRLHPTPAVGGLPKREGIEKILALEPFDRGLYAGALGWISPSASSFAVGIRSALWTPGHLHTFAGTGIVKGSNPKSEWDELNAKTSHWKNVCQTCH